MTDIVFIRDLKIKTRIGVYDWEQRVDQTVSFDIEMGVDTRPAAQSDDIADALDYKAVAKRVIEHTGDQKTQLVEKLANDVAELIRSEFSVRWVRVELHKLGAVTGSRSVGIIVQRGEREG